jgi:beta-galactosidase/beta-glucuronidase
LVSQAAATRSGLSGKRIFLHFEGVNQVADVFVNNAFVGRHEGGYTAFTFDVTKYVKFGAGGERRRRCR